MKKRLLLIFVAVVCLSPSVVFATDGYTGPRLTDWVTGGRSPSGLPISVKASGPDALGSYEISPPPGSEHAPPSGAKSDCTAKLNEIKDTGQFIEKTKQELPSVPEVSDSAVNG
jgi:hypothetical protein